MVDLLTTYLGLLQRGVALCDTLARVYEPDATLDWASRTLMQLGNMRMGLAGRLASPKLTPEQTSVVIGLISRYIDSHWADYQELPRPDAAKRAQVLELHEELTAVMNGVGTIDNAIYPSQPN
ncbi:MAG: hypothetical protein EOO63_10140 [Hymenobacter sp.]|nr:MAG: hypothetical protein EOO63_10140 [Hymenobacter sp.]